MHAHIRKHRQIGYKESFIQCLKAFLCFIPLQVLTLACFFSCCEVVNMQSDYFIFTKAKCDCTLSAHWPFHTALRTIWEWALWSCQHKLPFVLPALSGRGSSVRKWYKQQAVIIWEHGWMVSPGHAPAVWLVLFHLSRCHSSAMCFLSPALTLLSGLCIFNNPMQILLLPALRHFVTFLLFVVQ